MRIAITGGTGFIGSRLAAHCASTGRLVRILGQANNETETRNIGRLESAGVEVIQGTVTDPAVVAKVVDGCEVVYHLAATQHEMNVPDQRFWDVNVGGTKNVLDAASRAGVWRVVHGSTIGVYGSLEGPIDEASPCRPDNIYGVTKLEGERLALGQSGVAVVVVRIPEVYGPGDRRLLKLFRAIDRGAFFMIGSGKNLHQPIFVDDLVRGLLAAGEIPGAEGQLLLLAGTDAVTTRDMVEAIGAALGRKGSRFTVPLAPLWGLATIMELTLRPLGIQPPLHRRRMDFFRKGFTLDATRAKTVLGFQASTTFWDGAARTARWYRSEGLLTDTRHPAHAPSPSLIAPGRAVDTTLTARLEPFDSFWEAPSDIEKGYRSFATFYRRNYLRLVPSSRQARILVISCGPGYFVELLRQEGYTDVLGIDSFPEKIGPGLRRGLNCQAARAFGYLEENRDPFDCIIAEQELNHLTKDEILQFLSLARRSLRDGGVLIAHAINGAHPIVGSESRWGNFDHYNAWTQYSLRQAMEYGGFDQVEVFDLKLYVFYRNPLNYVALTWDAMLRLFFRFSFKMVGKSNTLFSKKIGTVGRRSGTER